MEKKGGKKQSTLKDITHHTIQKYDTKFRIFWVQTCCVMYILYILYTHTYVNLWKIPPQKMRCKKKPRKSTSSDDDLVLMSVNNKRKKLRFRFHPILIRRNHMWIVRGIVSESRLTRSKSICMSEAKEYYFMISMSLCIQYLCAFWATRGLVAKCSRLIGWLVKCGCSKNTWGWKTFLTHKIFAWILCF